MKTCKDCNTIKDTKDYYINSANKDGLGSYCKLCSNRRSSIWASKNPEKIKERQLRFYYKHLERERIRARNKSKNADKAKLAKATKKYRKSNAGKVNAINGKRRGAKLNATPLWLTDYQLREIQEFYILARELSWLNNGETLHVDHIIPLQGENVCGLHVPWNLQILPKQENCKKSNKF